MNSSREPPRPPPQHLGQHPPAHHQHQRNKRRLGQGAQRRPQRTFHRAAALPHYRRPARRPRAAATPAPAPSPGLPPPANHRQPAICWNPVAPAFSAATAISATVLATDKASPSVPAASANKGQPARAGHAHAIIKVATPICTTARPACHLAHRRQSTKKMQPTPNISNITPISALTGQRAHRQQKGAIFGGGTQWARAR